MSAKHTEPYVCFVCTHPSRKHYDFLRHLSTHGVNEQGQPLSDAEKARYKAYNSHKPRTNPKAKRTYKSAEFVDVSLETDESDTTPMNSPVKKTKSVDSPMSSPEKPLDPPKSFSQVEADLMVSDTSSDGEVFSEPEPAKPKSPSKSPIKTKSPAPQTSPAKIIPKHKHPIPQSKPKSQNSSPATDPCVRKPIRPPPVVSGPKTAEPKPISMPIITKTPKSKPIAKPRPSPIVATTNATELSKIAREKSALYPTPTSAPVPKVSRIKKLCQQIPVPSIPTPTIEQAQQALRRTKSVPSSKLVRHAAKLDHAASDIATEFAQEYGLKAEEWRQCIRQVCIVRMAQRNLSQRIRRQWQWTGESNRQEFLGCWNVN